VPSWCHAERGMTCEATHRSPEGEPEEREGGRCDDDACGRGLQHLSVPDGGRITQDLRLSALHRQVLRLLGPAYECRYLVSCPRAR
jgi:hypothetical protein